MGKTEIGQEEREKNQRIEDNKRKVGRNTYEKGGKKEPL